VLEHRLRLPGCGRAERAQGLLGIALVVHGTESLRRQPGAAAAAAVGVRSPPALRHNGGVRLPPTRPLALWAAGTLVALGLACAAPPEPAPLPPLRVEVSHFAGTVLTGPTSEEPSDEAPVDALGLTLRIALLERTPQGDPLPARLVVVDGLPDPFRTGSQLALGARRTPPGEPGAVLWEGSLAEALVAGGTTVVALQPERSLPDAPRPPWERLELEVSRRLRAPGEIEVALALTGMIALRVEDETDPQTDGEPARVELVHARERVVLEGALRPADPPWRLAFPAPTGVAPQGVIVVELGTLPVADPEAAERAREGVATARLTAAAQATGLSGQEGFRIQSSRAFEALSQRALERRALLYLAGQTGAELLGELALVADIESLADLREAGREQLATLREASIEPPALGWLLDSISWRWLAGLAAERDETPLRPELDALLLRMAGEAGRWPDLLLDALEESESSAALRQRIGRENRIFLEDADPAARVRAYDWLAGRGLAPEGFDPLASAAERRAALARLEQAQGEAEDGR